jgi:hypothetical protein
MRRSVAASAEAHSGVSALETGLADAGSVSFLHPIECVMLPVLDLDPVL